MQNLQRTVASIQVLPFYITFDGTIVPQFGGADEKTQEWGVYKRMNDGMCVWHEDHTSARMAKDQAERLATTYGVRVEDIPSPAQVGYKANPNHPPLEGEGRTNMEFATEETAVARTAMFHQRSAYGSYGKIAAAPMALSKEQLEQLGNHLEKFSHWADEVRVIPLASVLGVVQEFLIQLTYRREQDDKDLAEHRERRRKLALGIIGSSEPGSIHRTGTAGSRFGAGADSSQHDERLQRHIAVNQGKSPVAQEMREATGAELTTAGLHILGGLCGKSSDEVKAHIHNDDVKHMYPATDFGLPPVQQPLDGEGIDDWEIIEAKGLTWEEFQLKFKSEDYQAHRWACLIDVDGKPMTIVNSGRQWAREVYYPTIVVTPESLDALRQAEGDTGASNKK